MEKLKKIFLPVLCLIVFSLSATGCNFFSNDETVDTGFMVSYLNRDMTKTVKKPYELSSPLDDSLSCVNEILDVMSSETGDLELIKAIPDGVGIDSVELDASGRLDIYMDSGYTDVDSVREILCRLALVQTLTQLDKVDSIFIYVDGKALCDAKGYMVGAMTLESFVENPGEQIDSIQSAKITLYFSNYAGDGLVAETQTVHYSSNTSIEKLVVERLIKGPVSANAEESLPEGTALVNISVADRVCYVSFNDAFKNQNYDVKEETVIYSIVNSLAGLSHIDKVQISINGDTSGVYREKMSLASTYEFDGSMIKKAALIPEVIVEDSVAGTNE